MATRRKRGDGALDAPAPPATVTVYTVTDQQKAVVRDLHAYCDRLAVSYPGAPDTAAHREARELRTAIEQAFPDAFQAAP